MAYTGLLQNLVDIMIIVVDSGTWYAKSRNPSVISDVAQQNMKLADLPKIEHPSSLVTPTMRPESRARNTIATELCMRVPPITLTQKVPRQAASEQAKEEGLILIASRQP